MDSVRALTLVRHCDQQVGHPQLTPLLSVDSLQMLYGDTHDVFPKQAQVVSVPQAAGTDAQ
jgi:hypothetical protein